MPRKPSLNFVTVVILAAFALLGAACKPEVAVPDTPTSTPLIIITATLPFTQTPRPSATVEPPTATVPVDPVEGQTTSQLNVRSAPSADSDLLGTIQIFDKVQIVGKDPTSAWWMIVYPQSPTGTGWVSAQFVLVTSGSERVPVFNSPTQNVGNPAVTEVGPTLAPGAPTSAPPPAQPGQSLASAFEDGDSSQSPAVNTVLSKTNVHMFTYKSDISAPAGDPEDWVQFRLDGQAGQPTTVSVVINCTGSGALSVELLQNNSFLQGWKDLPCGHPSQLVLNLFVGAPYSLHLTPAEGNNVQRYINYTLTVSLQ